MSLDEFGFKKFARRKKLALMVGGLVLAFVLLLGGGVGWVSRDKAARQAQTHADIETALREAQVHQDQQKWPETLAVAKQAQALLASGGDDQELRRRVSQRVDDLELLVELDGARLRWTDVKKNALNYQESDAAFVRAFREHSLDVEGLDPQQAAALLGTRSIPIELAGALDTWAEVLRLQKKEGAIRLRNNALSHVALALSQSGHREEAVPEYHEALRLKPDYFDGHLNFGVTL